MKKLTIGLLIAVQCAAQAASINGFIHHAASNGKYELIFEGVNTLPKAFTTKSPDALVLDFPNTTSNIKREINIAANGIYNVDLIEGSGRTRAVINLASPQKYSVVQEGHNIVVSFDSSRRGVVRQKNSNAFSGFANSENSNIKGINNIVSRDLISHKEKRSSYLGTQTSLSPTFVKKANEGGVVSFTLPPSIGSTNVRQDGNKIIISIDGYFASKSDQRRIDVNAYHTVVGSIDVFRTARGTNIVININKNKAIEFSSYQNGNLYKVEIKKMAADRSLQKQVNELQSFSPSKRYHGAPLSLNFQDIEVRAVLQIIAEFTRNNIVVSDAVSGNITLRLDNVPWDQALDIILKTKGLGMRKNGSVIYVAPASELNQQELDALQTIQKRDQLIPAQTELIQVKYSNAADLAKILEQSRAANNGNIAGSILSNKGTVRVDTRTNTLLVSDIPSKLQAVRDLVAKLDEPVRQVLVDARLVLTSDNFTSDIGSRLGITFINSGKGTIGSGNLNSTSTIWDSLGKKDGKVKVGGLGDRLGVNLPAASSGSNYALAILGSDYLVDLELSALQTEGKAEILSSPRVVTQDGKKARIASGQQIPYTSVSDKGTSVEFKNAELSLDVTPRIAPDNRVDMILDVKKDSPNPALQSNGNIGINTNQLQTNVLVDNAETIVLGGIYEQNQSVGTDKVPLLGDLPVIGNAFKRTNKKFNKSELLIFVTPRIIDNRLTDYDKFSNIRN